MIIANTTQYFQGTLQSLSHLITSATPRDRDLHYPFLNDVNMRLREIISSHQVNLERKDKKGPWTLNQQVCIYLALNPKGSYFSLLPKSNQSPNLLFFRQCQYPFPLVYIQQGEVRGVQKLSPYGKGLAHYTGWKVGVEQPAFKVHSHSTRLLYLLSHLTKIVCLFEQTQREGLPPFLCLPPNFC